MKSPVRDASQVLYEAEVTRFRQTLAKGRSANQLALFDLLVARSADERPPKEIEIAVALFGESSTVDSGGDSGVRVYVHRLRKRMEDYYGQSTGPRLVIPKGAYRIVLDQALPSPAPRLPVWWQRVRQIDVNIVVGLAIIACAAVGLGAWLLWPLAGPRLDSEAGLGSKMIARAASGPFHPVIVVGDGMLLAKSDDQRSVRRMVLDPAIRTRDDFGAYLKAHPESFYKLYDFDLHFAPVAAVESGWVVSDFLHTGADKDSDPIQMLPVSALTDDMRATRDIVYVGKLSQLGALSPETFAQSRFTLVSDERLADRKTGRHYAASTYTVPSRDAAMDYGYFAIRTSAMGRRLIILAGIGDNGTQGVSKLLQSSGALLQIRRAVGDAPRFEALFAIKAVSRATFQHRLIAANPLP
jgi:hypothetical protein